MTDRIWRISWIIAIIGMVLIILVNLSGCAPVEEVRSLSYLPLVIKSVDGTLQRLGTHWWGTVDAQYIVSGQWIRYTVQWDQVEATQGNYTWPAAWDNAMIYFNAHSNPILINFHRSPAWARDSAYLCEMPNDAALDDFVTFVLATIARYRPAAIEVWNEVETSGEDSAQLYWCCGCGTVTEYNIVLSAVYSAVKAAYPDVVIVGGSLLSADSAWTKTWLSLSPKMDVVSIHYYRQYGQTLDTSQLIENIKYLDDRASVPIWLGETALLCDPVSQVCEDVFRQQQAEWLRMVYSVGGVDKIFWFTGNWANWMECNLVNEITDVAYPAFLEFRELTAGEMR